MIAEKNQALELSFDSESGIATLAFAMEGGVNKVDEAFARGLDGGVDWAKAQSGLKGVILTSAHKNFCVGADIDGLVPLRDAEQTLTWVAGLNAVFRKLETMGVPVACALVGSALGGGYEVALACHYRVALDSPKVQIGLPEVSLGVIPGAGGTQRLPRLVGIQKALEHITQGQPVRAEKAHKLGLVEALAPTREAVLAAARQWILDHPGHNRQPWDQKGFKFPGGAPYTPAGFPTFFGGVAMINGKTRGAFPAPKAMLSAIYEGALVGFDTAIRIEARWFTSIIMNPSSEAMIRSLFINKQALEKGASRPRDIPDQSVKKLGVLGAGMMGAGVAYVALIAGIDVVLIDRDRQAADRGRATVEGLLDGAIKARRLDADGKAATLARLTATPDYAALKGCDLVVEAVFEDPKIKAAATVQAEAHLGEGAIFATNTSTLPISGLAKASRDPARYIGIHFFSPVHKMMLVEIIKGAQTGPQAVAKALDFVRQLRKTPIVVNDARFFYANRCIIPYINEGLRMITEGVAPALIDNAARMLGMPVGPLQLTDETSLELGLSIARATKAAMGDACAENPADALLAALVETHGRKGRKNGKGLYDYDDKGKRLGFWPGLAQMHPHAEPQPPLGEVQNRLMLAQALEAVRALEQGVLTDIREGDVGAILGWGFAPWSGGPFAWLDITGPAQAVAICDALAEKHGDRFAAPALLREMATRGETFYARFAQAKAA